MSLQELPNNELLEQLLDMTRFYHYSPHSGKRPSTFDLDDLEDEVRRRLNLSNPETVLDADDC